MDIEKLTKQDLEDIGREVPQFIDKMNELLEGTNMFIIALSIIAVQKVIASSDPSAWAAANAFTKRSQT